MSKPPRGSGVGPDCTRTTTNYILRGDAMGQLPRPSRTAGTYHGVSAAQAASDAPGGSRDLSIIRTTAVAAASEHGEGRAAASGNDLAASGFPRPHRTAPVDRDAVIC